LNALDSEKPCFSERVISGVRHQQQAGSKNMINKKSLARTSAGPEKEGIAFCSKDRITPDIFTVQVS
jgi:hypothetical protein